jgi:hypothetical protein
MGYVIQALVFVTVLVLTSVVSSRALRRTRRQIEIDSTAIREWAQVRGWRVEDGWSQQIEEMGILLMEQGQRGVGTVVVGQNPAGAIVIAETWRDDEPEASERQPHRFEVGPSVDISYALAAAESPTLIEIALGIRAVTGEAPPTQEQIEVLAGMPEGSRLRVMSNRVLVRLPGYFSAELVDKALQRLAKLEVGKGPFR